MPSSSIERLLSYLSHFGEVNYKPYADSEAKKFDYASIEIITTKEIVDNLEQEINLQLTLENGLRANLRFIAWHEIQKKGDKVYYRYMADIIPFDFVPRSQWEKATEDVLQRLPHIIRNYRMKNPSKKR